MNARIHADRIVTPDLRTEDDFSLPGWTYSDPEFFDLERQVVFRKCWHLVCHVNDVPEAGDFQTLNVINESILTVRGKDGQVRSFHNVCRHRASRLVNSEHGNCGHMITCPYHAWSYDYDGRLLATPNVHEDELFEREDYPLNPVAVGEEHGFLFVSLAENPRPLHDFLVDSNESMTD